MNGLNGFRPNRAEKQERKKTLIFGKGYHAGVKAERERIIEELLKDAVIITNLDVRQLERVVEIVEG
jgi:hypothetical protein